MSEIQACQFLVNKTQTPFVAELHDDNYLIPAGLESCIKFLKQNPDYSACRGVGLSVKTQNTVAQGALTKCAIKKQPKSELDNGAERYLDFLQDYSDVCFSVHRTEIYQLVLENAHLNDWVFFKILSSAYVFIVVKVKKLDILVLVRHMQDNPQHAYEATSALYWFSQPNWGANLSLHRQFIVEQLIRVNNLSEKDAVMYFESGFMNYLATVTAHRYLRKEPRRTFLCRVSD